MERVGKSVLVGVFWQILEWIKSSFLENLAGVASVAVLGNVFFGILVGVVSCVCLYKGAHGAGGYYSFQTAEARWVLVWTILGMVFITPPFPLGQRGSIKLMSMAVCFSVCLITSVTDEKSQCFTLGYLLLGIILEVVLLIFGGATSQVSVTRSSLVTMLICMVSVVILGTFCFSMGDAGLLLMALLSYMICLEQPLWVAATIVTMVVAGLSFVVRYAFYMLRASDRMHVRLPFSLHVYIGVAIAFFLLE